LGNKRQKAGSGTRLKKEVADGNRDLYGREISAAEIIRELAVRTPEAGLTLDATLQNASPKLKP
jgi:hypothetical protein